MPNTIGFRGSQFGITSTTTLSVSLPTERMVGDLALIGVSSPGYQPTTPTGWTLEASVSTGTAGAAGCVGLWIYSRVLQSGDSSAVTFTGLTASYAVGISVALYGVNSTFIDATPTTGTTTPASTTFTQPSITTVTDHAWIVGFIGVDLDSLSNAFSTPPVNATLVDETLRRYYSMIDGVGGQLGVSTSRMATAGATGAATVTGTSSISVSASVAIRPQATEVATVYQETARVVASYDTTLLTYQETVRVVRTKNEVAPPTQAQPQIVICM